MCELCPNLLSFLAAAPQAEANDKPTKEAAKGNAENEDQMDFKRFLFALAHFARLTLNFLNFVGRRDGTLAGEVLLPEVICLKPAASN